MFKNPLRAAGIAGIILFIFVFFYSMIIGAVEQISPGTLPLNIFQPIYSLITLFLTIVFYYGFIYLGKKYDSKLLVSMSWILIILGVLVSVFFMLNPVEDYFIERGLALNDTLAEYGVTEDFNGEMPEEAKLALQEFLMEVVLIALLAFAIFSIVLGVFTILFGVGLLKIKKKVKLAKASGILEIIAGATYILFIGYLIAIAAGVVEIIMFFKAANVLDKKKK